MPYKHSTRIYLYFWLILTACTTFSTWQPRQALIMPDTVTGLDSDLWQTFVGLINDPDCRLPCWWGFEVGKTHLDEVVTFLQETDFSRAQARSPYPDMPLRDYITAETLGLDFVRGSSEVIGEVRYHFDFDDNNIMELISLGIHRPNLWLPDTYNPLLLTALFRQIEAIPNIFTVYPQNYYPHEYPLFVVYPEQSIEIHYTLDFTEMPEICLDGQNIESIGMKIYADSERLMRQNHAIIPLEEAHPFAEITAEVFVQFFREHPDECLDVRDF
jgi:hypothetical protein